MRKRIAVAVLAAILLAVPTLEATTGSAKVKPELRPPKGCSSFVSATDFAPFSARVWKRSRWDRPRKGAPKDSTLRAMRMKRRCALSPSHRRKMKKDWGRDKRAFYRHRGKKRDDERYLDALYPPGLAVLETIAACESGGDPTAVSSDGSYRGKYQFDFGTWASVGGSGDPAAASEREQDERAAELYRRSGPAPWPVCGV